MNAPAIATESPCDTWLPRQALANKKENIPSAIIAQSMCLMENLGIIATLKTVLGG